MSHIHRGGPPTMFDPRDVGVSSDTSLIAANATIRITVDSVNGVQYGGAGTGLAVDFGGMFYGISITEKLLTGRGGAKNFDVQYQKLAGTTPTTGLLVNTWYNLSTTRQWGIGRATNGITSTTGRLRFRSNSTLQEITTANVGANLFAAYSSTGTDTK